MTFRRKAKFYIQASQTLVNLYQTPRRLIPEDGELWCHNHDIIKSRINQLFL